MPATATQASDRAAGRLCAAAASGKRPDLSLVNGEAKALIVVSSMWRFLDRTISYFRTFIDAALEAADTARAFRSERVALRC